MRLALRLLGVLSPLLLFPMLLTAQTVRGKVVDAEHGDPIGRAAVLLIEPNGRTTSAVLSDDDGVFVVSASQAGDYSLRAGAPGYPYASSSPFALVAADTLQVTLRLSRRAVLLAPLTVTGRSNSARKRNQEKFLERREKEFGLFLDPKLIDRLRPMYPTNLLQGIPGIILIRGDNRPIVMMKDMAGEACSPTVYIDGARIPMPEGESIDAYWAEGRHLRALEIYREATSAPIGFSARGDCGVLVFWTDHGFAG